MFKVDLLNGQGVPVRSGPQRIVVAAVAFGVPIVVAAVMVGAYLSSHIAISITQHAMSKYELTAELNQALQRQRRFDQDRNAVNSVLEEVSAAITRHTQWLPILETVVENIPPGVVLTRIEASQEFVKSKAPMKGDPDKKVDVSIPVRTLKMGLAGSQAAGCDEAVRAFTEKLNSSPVLGPRLRDILIDQKGQTFEGKDAVVYDIDCPFKPGL
jgi:Tfp pilus assembly protein PilN